MSPSARSIGKVGVGVVSPSRSMKVWKVGVDQRAAM